MFTSEHWRQLRATGGPDLHFSAGAAFALARVSRTRVLGVGTNDPNARFQARIVRGDVTKVPHREAVTLEYDDGRGRAWLDGTAGSTRDPTPERRASAGTH